jgi:flagellar biosynthesis protein FlhF
VLGLLGRSKIEVIAAVDTDLHDFPVPTSAADQTIQTLQNELSALKMTLANVSDTRLKPQTSRIASLDDWYRRLINHGVAESLAQQIIRVVSDELSRWALDNETVLNEHLHWYLSRQIPKSAVPNLTRQRPCVLFVIGPTGVGKTTTLAKLAANFAYRTRQGIKVLLITTDTFRVAAIPQIVTLGELLNVPVQVAYSPSQLARIVEDNQAYDLILVDTPGRSQRATDELAELSSYLSIVEEKLVYLAVTAGSKYEDMNCTVKSFGHMPIDGLVITKVDETISLGSVYTLTCETGLPICYLTNGQRIPEDLEAATPEKVVDLMVGAVPDQLRSTTLNVKDRRYECVDLFLEKVL